MTTSNILDQLYDVIENRKKGDPENSHTARLFSRGTAKIAQKTGEEAVECVIEALRGDARALTSESADLLFHLMVLWADQGVRPQDVWAELARRQGVSGITEKNTRPRD